MTIRFGYIINKNNNNNSINNHCNSKYVEPFLEKSDYELKNSYSLVYNAQTNFEKTKQDEEILFLKKVKHKTELSKDNN